MQWLSANPRISIVDLARKLARGVCGFGLELAIYHDAARQGVVRMVAKELLIREILEAFPNGWATKGDVHPLVKISNWNSGVTSYARDSSFEEYANQIARHLAIDNPPQEGWTPAWPNDPLIDELFDKYWPV